MFIIKIYNKLFVTFIVFLFIILLFFNNSCFAFSFQKDDIVYDFGDVPLLNYNILYAYYDSSNSLMQFTLYSYENEPCFNSDNNLHVKGKWFAHIFFCKSNKVVIGKENNYTDESILISLEQLENECVYSNFDIKNEEGSVLFQRPVMSLAESLVTAEPVKTYQIMIHGMIIFLVVFLVGLVAFWKAWSFLSKELRKA